MKYQLIIEADENDGDYVTKISVIDETELEFVKRIAGVLNNTDFPYGKARWRYRGQKTDWEEIGPHEIYAGWLTETDIDRFFNYIPYAEDGVHTIASIEYAPYHEMVKLL